MEVSIVQEWNFPEEGETFTKLDSADSMFYIVRLQMGRQHFLKVGTTERTIKARFSAKDYKKYSSIKFIYVAELTSTKKPGDACYHVEDLTRSAIREMKGFTFVKNDRFKYFQLPPAIPVYTGLNRYEMVSLRK